MAQSELTKHRACNTNNKARAYCFTLNNYTDNEKKEMEQYFYNSEYLFGEEIGESGTPHLQGCVRFPNPVSFEKLKKQFPRAHWEKCKNWKASIAYCKKDGIVHSNIKEENTLESVINKHMTHKYTNITWKQWQLDILKLIETVPDDRTINWIYESRGCAGKTFLAKYIVWKYNAVIVNGKQSDIFNGIKSFIDGQKKFMDIVIIDIPRTNQNYVCYGTMEKLKDGLFYSGKYEGGQILMPPIHLIVFANFHPDKSTMSEDRWNVVLIE